MKRRIGKKTLIMPMPCLLVGTYSEDGTPNAMAAAWAAVCCLAPPCVGVAIRRNRLTFANLARAGAFTLNVPRAAQAAAVDYLGTVSGSEEPKKLEKAGLASEQGSAVKAPILTDCPINIECSLRDRMALGSHTWFVGKIEEVHVDEEALDESGEPRLAAIDPLIYIPQLSEYHALGRALGKAFSIGKAVGG